MAYRTPPFISPFAIVSIVLALGATNVVVNKTTHTVNGAKASSSVVKSSSATSSSAKKKAADG
ncbi:hypothetical protein [Lactiplantibacillus pentosus]|uniref:hypothetical protein n=1 Tax=Lactiplantibacillus pentosus TaxID=1589 RepID=UPI0020A7FB26|nr:hypothetical protein [Lactiplantibacillus pentosus]MDT6965809.1 hypothetical protein [Lactiplantibacillus pentosus]MDT7000402.1 hypothetical protein [Lactiplantibacillus pentosus]